MKNKDEGIFNAIKPKATVLEFTKINTTAEMADALTKLAKKQSKSKSEVNLEDFRGIPLSKIITIG